MGAGGGARVRFWHQRVQMGILDGFVPLRVRKTWEASRSTWMPQPLWPCYARENHLPSLRVEYSCSLGEQLGDGTQGCPRF